MSRVTIPLDLERIAAAKAELADLSDDAVVYIAGLVYLAEGLSTPELPGLAVQAQAVRDLCVESSDALINLSDTTVPNDTRLRLATVVEHLFSMLPARPKLTTLDTAAGALLSSDGRFRYSLWRRWGTGPLCVWIMLNPSTADAIEDDATIRRCVGFARMWGLPGVEVVNLYPMRSTDPKAMLCCPDRQGPRHALSHLRRAIVLHRNAVCAWGAHAEPEVAARVANWAEVAIGWQSVSCLGLTKSGQPRHPLRLPYATPRAILAFSQGRRP